jgi:hypothetical protein
LRKYYIQKAVKKKINTHDNSSWDIIKRTKLRIHGTQEGADIWAGEVARGRVLA